MIRIGRRHLLPAYCAAIAYCIGATAQTPNSITGKAVNAATGSPLSHATVSLEQAKDGSLFASVTTDENGNFQFLRLSADRYILRGSHRGYIITAYDAHDNFTTALVTGAGQNCCANLQLKLIPGGVIAGTVAEDTGDPVGHGVVTLYRDSNRTGEERVQRVRAANVDESGVYEFAGLEPGNYFVSATGQTWYSVHARVRSMAANRDSTGGDTSPTRPPMDLVYATEFYPDTTDEKSAAPIPIKGGEHLVINFSLHPIPALHLTVQTPQTPEGGRSGFFMPPIEHQVFGVTEPLNFSPLIGGRRGMEISVPPGQYEVRIPERDGNPGKVITVDASTDQAIDLATGSALADVSGKLAPSSGDTFPDNLFVSLMTLEGSGSGGTRLENDGSFTIHGVAPGVYRLNIVGGGKRFHVSKMMASGAQIGHRQITIGSGSVTLAATIYEDLGLSVSGFAKQNGVVTPGAMIVLMPADPVRDRDYFRRAQSDSDGNFVLKNVEPGKYTAVAIQDGWSLDWAQPDVIRHYAQRGQQLNITEQSPQTTQLSEALEVQPK